MYTKRRLSAEWVVSKRCYKREGLLIEALGMTVDHQLMTLPPEWFGTRHKQMLLSFFAQVVYGLNSSSLVVGIVAMTQYSDNSLFPTLDYTMSQKGILLGMFGYGCTVGTGLFGYLADLHGPMRISAITGGICCGLLSFAFPWIARFGGFEFGCAVQVLQGFMSGSAVPCVYAHMSRWVVPQEQSNFSWIWSGYQCGGLLSSLLPGPLARLMGWPGIFYFSGGLGLMWGVCSLVWGADCPADHKSININEKMYIESRIPAKRNSKLKTPWMEMLKSKPLWALFIVQTCDWFGWYMGPTFVPTYLNQVFNLSLTEVGFVTAFSCLLKILAAFIFTYLAVKVSTCASPNFSRKMWNSVAMYGGAIAFFLMAIVPQSLTAAITFNGVIYITNAAAQSGFVMNILDMAPSLAGTLSGSVTTMTNIIACTSPIITGLLVHDETDGNSWSLVFWTGGAVYALGNTVFLVMGSTDVQPWNNPSPTSEISPSESKDQGTPTAP